IWLLARRDEGAYPQRSVTEEQRSQKPNAVQPSGRHVFLAQTSLFAPYRPLKGMLVAHASSEPKSIAAIIGPNCARLRRSADLIARSDPAGLVWSPSRSRPRPG